MRRLVDSRGGFVAVGRRAHGGARQSSIRTIRIWSDDDARIRRLEGRRAGGQQRLRLRRATRSCNRGERRNVRAMNVNTLDEVPDSSWFTNRIGRREIPLDELVRGPDRGPP